MVAGAAMLRATPIHEEGVLKVERRQFAPGDSLHITGEKFGASNRLVLALEGLAGRVQLRTVTADTAGAFVTAVLVPPDLDEGSYRLLALADDGDEAAGLDVTVIARVEDAAPVAAMEEDAHAMDHPSDEPLAVNRARSSLVTGGVLLGVALAVIAAVILLRAPAKREGGPR